VKKQVNVNHSRAPLWRLFVLQDPSAPSKFALFASFHHLAADGMYSLFSLRFLSLFLSFFFISQESSFPGH
jgi:hypothetical protein